MLKQYKEKNQKSQQKGPVRRSDLVDLVTRPLGGKSDAIHGLLKQVQDSLESIRHGNYV